MVNRLVAQQRRHRSASTLRRQARRWLNRVEGAHPHGSFSAQWATTDRALARLYKTDPELRRAVSEQIWEDLVKTLAKQERFYARWLKEAKKRAAARAPYSARWRRQAAILARL